jgi:peroxiredoxin
MRGIKLAIKKGEEPIMAKVELNQQAPEFTLPDFNGTKASLSEFTDRKNVLVVFNRGFF